MGFFGGGRPSRASFVVIGIPRISSPTDPGTFASEIPEPEAAEEEVGESDFGGGGGPSSPVPMSPVYRIRVRVQWSWSAPGSQKKPGGGSGRRPTGQTIVSPGLARGGDLDGTTVCGGTAAAGIGPTFAGFGTWRRAFPGGGSNSPVAGGGGVPKEAESPGAGGGGPVDFAVPGRRVQWLAGPPRK